MTDKTIINTNLAPAAIGVYSQAVKVGDTVYLSGQIPLIPESMDLVEGGFEDQAHQVFRNLGAVCTAAKGGLQSIVNNFVSGLIILLERPIKKGDIVQVGDTSGRVLDIKARSTLVLTRDDVVMIVPNSDFITKQAGAGIELLCGRLKVLLSRTAILFGVGETNQARLLQRIDVVIKPRWFLAQHISDLFGGHRI